MVLRGSALDRVLRALRRSLVDYWELGVWKCRIVAKQQGRFSLHADGSLRNGPIEYLGGGGGNAKS